MLHGYNKLRSLTLTNCPNVVDAAPLAGIHTLIIEKCDNITDVAALKDVKLLKLKDCLGITDVSLLTNVEELSLRGCKNITADSMGKLRNVFGKDAPTQELMSANSKWFYNVPTV